MILWLDLESYYDREYSLKNKEMTPAKYILDDRWETILMGVAVDDGPVEIIDGPDVGRYLGSLDPAQVTTFTYNSLFDNAVLSYRYGFVPARMVDGLGMARALLGSRLRSLSLQRVAEYLELPAKGDAIHNVVGMHREDIMRDPVLWDRYRAYCAHDVHLLREIVRRLHPEFPKEEYGVMDAVLRTCVEPSFICDVELLGKHLGKIRAKKDRLVDAVGTGKDAISGNLSFLELLKNAGVEIKYKEGKKGPIPAIAKTDAFMQELLEDERTEVQCLAAARLGIKSTLEESRCERLIQIASLPWRTTTSLMPIPLRYSGAHTWRLSGDWKINMQNLPSARTGDPVLRKSLMAPDGHKIVVGDLAQIEARLVAWFAGCNLLLTEFRDKLDPYSMLASVIFGTAVDKSTMGGVARHIGKAGIVGCGYGMGPDKFFTKTLESSRAQLKPEQMEILRNVWTPDLARESVQAYRYRYSDVKAMWRRLDNVLERSWTGRTGPAVLGPVTVGHRDGYGYVAGPGGREIRYPSPMDKDFELWWFHAGIPSKIYGASFLENIIQFLARIVMFDIAMRLRARGFRFIHQVHDELVFCVADDMVPFAVALLQEEMKTPPAWCKDLPLDCDVGFGRRYGDCK